MLDHAFDDHLQDLLEVAEGLAGGLSKGGHPLLLQDGYIRPPDGGFVGLIGPLVPLRPP